MRALVLAAGLGTRLRPLTEAVPKCLVPIRGRPLLDFWFDLLLARGLCERVLINTSWLAEKVRAYVAQSQWWDRVDMVHEEALLGTGGTVLANRDWFGKGPFIVAHGDNLTRFDLSAFIASHCARPGGAAITMMTFETDAPQSCGIVELDHRGVVVAMHEKVSNAPGNHANGAVYIFEPSVVDYIQSLGKQVVDLSTEVLPAFMGRIYAFHNADYHRDIGSMGSLQKANIEY